jgi:hypothetical protein
VLITPEEADLLEHLRQRPLDSFTSDGWTLFLRSGDRVVAFLPEEVATPARLHPRGDVVRVGIADHEGGGEDAICHELAVGLGIIRGVSLLTTAITLSPPTRGAPYQLLGVTIPEGIDYRPRYLHPDDPVCRALQESDDVALVVVHVGVVLEAERGRVLVFTDGCGFFVHALVGDGTHERLRPLEGAVLSVPLHERASRAGGS